MGYYLVAAALLLCGALLVAGAVLDWKWITTREKERPKGMGHWIYSQFGEKGYRVTIGLGGGVTLLMGLMLLLG